MIKILILEFVGCFFLVFIKAMVDSQTELKFQNDNLTLFALTESFSYALFYMIGINLGAGFLNPTVTFALFLNKKYTTQNVN